MWVKVCGLRFVGVEEREGGKGEGERVGGWLCPWEDLLFGGLGRCVVCASNGTDGFRWAHRRRGTTSSVLLRWIGLLNVVGIARSSSALPVTMQWSRSYAR